MLAATGDEGFGSRIKRYAEPLRAKYGIASIIVMAPFYAKRRAKDQISGSVLTVENYVSQCYSTCWEAASMLRGVRERHPSLPVGVTGVSTTKNAPSLV